MTLHLAVAAKRTKVAYDRTLHTFAYLWNVSWVCRDQAGVKAQRRNPYLAASMIFSAFTLEAFLNHIGATVIPSWSKLERKLSPPEKLRHLSKHLRFELDFDRRPFKTVQEMKRFRDALAHGKTLKHRGREVQELLPDQFPSSPLSKWEREICRKRADIYRKDTKGIIDLLSKEANVDPNNLFVLHSTGFVTPPTES